MAIREILKTRKYWLPAIVITVAGIGAAFFVWQSVKHKGLGAGFASGNGRIEAVEIDIAAKTAGRITAILVDEGDFVTVGQVLATMDTPVLEAQRREAQARLRQAENGIQTARSQVVQRESEKATAQAVVIQREAEVDAVRRRLARAESLVADGAIAIQQLDDARASFLGTEAVLRAAESQIAAADAAIAAARSPLSSAPRFLPSFPPCSSPACSTRSPRWRAWVRSSATSIPPPIFCSSPGAPFPKPWTSVTCVPRSCRCAVSGRSDGASVRDNLDGYLPGNDRALDAVGGLEVDDQIEPGRLLHGRSLGFAPVRILST